MQTKAETKAETKQMSEHTRGALFALACIAVAATLKLTGVM